MMDQPILMYVPMQNRVTLTYISVYEEFKTCSNYFYRNCVYRLEDNIKMDFRKLGWEKRV
jgi:hypothetical protein